MEFGLEYDTEIILTVPIDNLHRWCFVSNAEYYLHLHPCGNWYTATRIVGTAQIPSQLVGIIQLITGLAFINRVLLTQESIPLRRELSEGFENSTNGPWVWSI